MTRAQFSAADLAILGAYAVLTLLIGFYRRRRSAEDYLIANRQLSVPVLVATLVATWYGGILGVGEMTYRYGLINWTTQALPYYIMAILFALFLAGKIRRAALYTIPDKLAEAFDRRTALLGACCTFVMATPAPYVLMIGQLVHLITGWPLIVSTIIGLLLSVVYVFVGGFQSDVRINVFQFLLMFAGFVVALPVVSYQTGGYHWLVSQLPADHLRLDGGLGLGYVAVWFFIALWTFVDPGFHQRCYAARSPHVARRAVLIAVLCWACFDFLTTSTGLYARAAVPDIPENSAVLAFPILAERFLPAGVKGFFYVALLATIMSTLVSYSFVGAMTIGRDFLWRLRGGSDEVTTALTRLGLVLTSVLAIVIALTVPSVVQQWWAIGTVCVPALLLPVLTAYAPAWRVSAGATALVLIAGGGVAGSCLITGWLRHGIHADMSDSSLFPFGVQPMYPGLIAALTVYAATCLHERICRSSMRRRERA